MCRIVPTIGVESSPIILSEHSFIRHALVVLMIFSYPFGGGTFACKACKENHYLQQQERLLMAKAT